MNNQERVLSADNISISFGGLSAVSDFSCVINSGELVGLIGPNGAGKTTVFNMLSGIYTPSSGTICLNGKDGAQYAAHKMKPHELFAAGVSRTFQNIRLFSNLTAADNIRIALHSGKKMNALDACFRTRKYYEEERAQSERVKEMLSLFSIENRSEELAKNLPYGEQRKLEIARALAANPVLLLLDEPAAGMNPQETIDLMKLISFIREQFSVTVLLIEHDMRLVMGICERLIVLDYGRIIAAGTPEVIQRNPEVIKAYLGGEALIDA